MVTVVTTRPAPTARVGDEPRIVDVPEIVEVPDADPHEATWLPPGMARRLVVSTLGTIVVALFAIAVPLILTGTGAASAFGLASVPAAFCGGGFGAIFGAASFSASTHDGLD